MSRPVVLRVIWWVMVCVSAVGLVFAAISFREVQNPFLIFPIAAETVVGAVVARKRPENPMGWVFLGVGVLTGVLIMSAGLAEVALSTSGELPWWGLVSAWFGSWLWYPLLYLLSTLTLLLYPSGLLSRRWRPVLWLSTVSTACFTVVAALLPVIPVAFDPEGGVTRTVANPISPPFMSGTPSLEDSPAAGVLGTIFMGFLLAALVSSILRVKRSTGVEREQMRWFGFSIALIILLLLVETTASDLIPQVWLSLAEALVLSFFVVSCGVAILRYRLYDIDRIISRTTSYLVVTGSLIALYAVTVAAASELLRGKQPAAVAAATLLVAAAFRPLLRRVRRVVDRRFDREHFDAEQAVGGYADRLRAEVKTDVVIDDLISVVRQVVAPSRVTVWVRPVSASRGGAGR
jgi:hypothetical protein